MDKMYNNQLADNMTADHCLEMANSCGTELRRLIHTYTVLDTHQIENFL